MHEEEVPIKEHVRKLQKRYPNMSSAALERALYRSRAACAKIGQRE
jgi:hypothetical protein